MRRALPGETAPHTQSNQLRLGDFGVFSSPPRLHSISSDSLQLSTVEDEWEAGPALLTRQFPPPVFLRSV